MTTGNLIIDKASVDLSYLFKSLKIVEEHNGLIKRYDFVRQMELYMYGEIISIKDDSEESRTQFNKTKLARYYGLLKTSIDNYGNQIVNLTKRGKAICDIIDNKSLEIKDLDKLKEIILYSVLYDTFGRNNDGVETSESDIEPPKILLKSLLYLKYIKSEELIYLIYALNNQEYNSFDEAINHILLLRKEGNKSFIQNKIIEYKKENFVTDNKLLSFFNKIEIIHRNDNKEYYFNEDFLTKYKSIIQQLDPLSKNIQLIISGISGCGKSHFINNIILGNIIETKQVVRTIIHSDYSYFDFIGHIVPNTKNNKIFYSFNPGPFSLALKKALENPKLNIYLVIEEINRGNISAVFGDIFQLLDRNNDYKSLYHNSSKYTIDNQDIYNYLCDKIGEKKTSKIFVNKKIFLPTNFNIICTMNTADQNRFYLDTAFRRRFNNLTMQLGFKKENSKYLDEINTLVKKNIFNGKYDWNYFAQFINKKIDEFNKNFYTISEDKKLAPFFINKNDINNKNDFCDKVIYYLKNDVFKYIDNVFMDDYSTLKDKFINGYDILSEFEV